MQSSLTDNQKRILDFLINEYQSGHRNFSEITAFKLEMDTKEFREACVGLKKANIIDCMEKYRGDDPLPMFVYDMSLSKATINNL